MTATADDIRAQLAGYSPAAARDNEAKGDHTSALKFAPPWYEMKHFRAKWHIAGVRDNRNGIPGVVFELSDVECMEGTETNFIHVPLPKAAPGYPTDEINLMVEAAGLDHITAFDGLDAEVQLDYAEHPWMKERGRDGNDIVVGGVAVPKRCWYYKTVQVFNAAKAEVSTEPDEANVRKLANWCVGKTLEEVSASNALLKATAKQVLDISSDMPLQKLIREGKFLEYAAGFGLAVGTDGKFEVV